MAKNKKARKGTTHIALLLDQSGSMQSIKDDTIGSYNSYLASQQAVEGDKALWSLTLFGGDVVESRHAGAPIESIPPLTPLSYVPNGATPLYDAIGRTVADIETRIGAEDRAVLVILTDGEENASREWTYDAIVKRIKEVEARANWTVVYLGSTPNAVEIGRSLGLNFGNVAGYNPADTHATMDVLSANLTSYRTQEGTRSVAMAVGVGKKTTATT